MVIDEILFYSYVKFWIVANVENFRYLLVSNPHSGPSIGEAFVKSTERNHILSVTLVPLKSGVDRGANWRFSQALALRIRCVSRGYFVIEGDGIASACISKMAHITRSSKPLPLDWIHLVGNSLGECKLSLQFYSNWLNGLGVNRINSLGAT